MRLKSISVEGFRGFIEPASMNLDADVILLHGPNGAGKTSLLDAILWALVGRIDRFGDAVADPVSVYAPDGTARVELTLSGDGHDTIVTRLSGGRDNNHVRLTVGEEVLDGPSAEAKLIELVVPHLRERINPKDPLGRVLTRGVYLQQDLIREFVESDTAVERFSLISEVIGAGVVVELQAELERSKNVWHRAITSRRKEELDPLLERNRRLEDALARLEPTKEDGGLDDVPTLAKDFHAAALELLGRSRISSDRPPADTSSLDRLLKEITAERAQLDRSFTVASALLSQLQLVHQVQSDEVAQSGDALVLREKELESELTSLDAMIQKQFDELDDLRRLQTEDRDRRSRLATLARLALGEIDGPCPVCTQEHDKEHTARHLEELIALASSTPEGMRVEGATGDLPQRRAVVARELANVRESLARMRREAEERETSEKMLRQRLDDVGLADDELAEEALRQRITQLQERATATDALLARGETLAVSIIRVSETRQRVDLGQQLEEVTNQIRVVQAEIDAQLETYAAAGKIIDGLRDASLEITAKQVKAIQPVLQAIYSRIDPHPTFRVAQIVTAMEKGKGRLTAGVYDPERGKKMLEPGPVLSSSQLNSFAVSLFLALNLGLPSLKLGITILDDPLQSLDSINLLGLVDVLRRFRAHRQIIVSTHEAQLLGLLQRKLRPVRDGERVATIQFDRWSRRGPEFSEHLMTYEPDLNPQVVVAA